MLVAPRAQVIRDGQTVELLAEEVVPGDLVAIGPGDQLVADGRVIASRGLTLDESMLTGEADGIRKESGDEVLSGSFAISGSGHYEIEAVREDSYAGRLAGEAKAFRHPLSPLQQEVNRVIIVSTYAMIPLAILLLASLKIRSVGLQSAAETATAGLVTLIPEGLVLLMSVTFAVAAVRLARRDTLIQQMSATESLASVDTICVDKTGTLTEGELRLAGVEFADDVDPAVGAAVLGRFAASAGNRNQTLETIAERYPGDPGQVSRRGPLLLRVEVVGRLAGGQRGRRRDLRARRARHPRRGGRAGAAAGDGGEAGEETAAGRRVVAFGRSGEALPADAAAEPGAAAAADGADRAGGDAARGRRRDDRLHARAGSRPEADLRRRPGDGDRGRLRGRRAARRGRGRGAGPARRPRGAAGGGARQHDLLPDQAGAEESAGRRAGRRPGATWR